MVDAQAAVTAAWRQESARLIAALTRVTGDVGLAEDLAQDALVAALSRWPRGDIPSNPAAGCGRSHRGRRAAADVPHVRKSMSSRPAVGKSYSPRPPLWSFMWTWAT